jgi:uncharacterized membrane protein YjgN (DUF898 family)
MAGLMQYDGKLSGLYGVWLKNLLLQIITLSIYRPWGKTNMRRYVWSSFIIDGDRLEYTGKGGELLRGYMKIALIFFGLSLMVLVWLLFFPPAQEGEGTPLDHLQWLLIGYLFYFGRFSALRYRLTRTRWRGVRGWLEGSGRSYVWFRFKRTLMNMVSLGYLMGRTAIIDLKYLLDRTYIGSQKMSFEADEKALDKINMITAMLYIPTLSFSRLWFQAALYNLKYENMSLGDVRFRGHFTPGGLFKLRLGNLFILIFTLFFGIPIVINRMMKYLNEHVEVLGTIEGSQILQAPDNKAGNLGEGVEDSFDYDGLDFDIGII